MKKEFTQLVSNVLSGEASDKEKKSLEQMLLENSGHSQIYNQLKEYWDAEVHLTNRREKGSLEAGIFSKLSLEMEVKQLTLRKLFIRFSSAAAILFFAISCILAYLYTAAPKEYYTFSAQSKAIEYTLKDGTKVMLNKNSSVTYCSDYSENSRNVKLTGEAFFNVVKNKSKPFIVEALGTKTEDIGTSFNIKSNAENSTVTTTLVEGSILFKADNYNILLKPGQELIYNNGLKKGLLKKTDIQYQTAWTLGRYNYVDIKFADLAVKLAHIYHLKIEIADQKIAGRVVSASFLTDEPVEDILKSLQNELGFTYVKKDNNQINILSKTLNNQLPMD
jgi:ferric-dicitrate binding protein FerR (iron transport regulator)